MRLERSVKKPQRYRRFVQWDTVENHTVDFRGSADFQNGAAGRPPLRFAAGRRARG
jgi:hypothetical protein